MDPITVLVVDDELDFITPLSKRLGKRGVQVKLATSGRQALEKLARTEIDVILLDIKMPGMDGIETLRDIKRLHPYVEIMMLTAHGDSNTVISSLAMGACDFIMKPVELEVLMQKIEDAYSRRKNNLDQGSL